MTHFSDNPHLGSTIRRNAGLTLVEVLVTMLVTSVGLLGVAALHLTSLRNNVDSNFRSHASVFAADIADRMRANRMAALAGDYDISIGSAPPTPTTRVQWDLNEWKGAVATLPSGDGSIFVDPTSRIATIQVQWNERGAASAMSFSTNTEL